MPTKSPPNPSDEQFLDAVYARIFEQVEDGHRPLLEDFLSDRPHLKAEISKLIEIALEIAIAPSNHRPDLADFEIVSELGRGGMGAVYLARQLRAGGRLVALKILQQHAVPSEKARDRFVHEANTLAKLRHPNIVTLHDVILDHGVSAYAMEWIDGKPLSQLIERLRSFNNPTSQKGGTDSVCSDKSKSVSTPSMNNVADFLGASADAIRESSYTIFICRILISIARALAEVHRLGLTHRDVKPSNILLRRDGTALLTDFGLVRQPDSAVVTQTGHFIGTLAYASPEQLHGDHSSVGPCSDGYSLGVTLYHALTLQLPFTGQSPAELLTQIEGGRSASLRCLCRDLPRDLETIVTKAMDPEPSRRYATADDLADDLDRLLNLQPIKAKPATLVTRAMKAARRNRGHLVAAIVGGVFALALVSVAAMYWLVLPRWSNQSLTQARLALLHPEQGNAMFNAEFFGVEPSAQKLAIRPDGLQSALTHYDAALRWQPFDHAVRREREVVRLALSKATASQEFGGKKVEGVTPRSEIPALRSSSVPGGKMTGSSSLSLGEPIASSTDLRSTGLYAYLIGDAATAIDAWTKLDLQSTPDAFINAALGQLYIARGEHSRAYPRLSKAVEAFPNVSFLTQYLADAAVQCGDLEKAQQWLDLARTQPMQDRYSGIDRVQADLFAAEGRDDEAVVLYQTVSRGSQVAIFNYGLLLESRGRLREALFVLQDAVRSAPNSVRAREAFGRTLERWWDSLLYSQRRAEVRIALDRGSDGPLTAWVIAYTSAMERHSDKSDSSRFSPTLPRHPSASYLQRDAVSLATLARRMEVENVERWMSLNKLPSVMKDWLTESWLSPRPTLKGRFAEWCTGLLLQQGAPESAIKAGVARHSTKSVLMGSKSKALLCHTSVFTLAVASATSANVTVFVNPNPVPAEQESLKMQFLNAAGPVSLVNLDDQPAGPVDGTEWTQSGVEFIQPDAGALALINTNPTRTCHSEPNCLVPPDACCESLEMHLSPPSSVVGFWLIDSEATTPAEYIAFYDSSNNELANIPMPVYGSQWGGPEANFFIGVISDVPIARVLVNELDVESFNEGVMVDDLYLGTAINNPTVPPGFCIETYLEDVSPQLIEMEVAPPTFGSYGGQLFYSDRAGGDFIYRVDESGQPQQFAAAPVQIGFLKFGPGGSWGTDLYVTANCEDDCSGDLGRIYRITPAGTVSLFGTPTPPGDYFFGGGDIAFSEGGPFGTYLYSSASAGYPGDCISRVGPLGGQASLFLNIVGYDPPPQFHGNPGAKEFGNGLNGFTTNLYVNINSSGANPNLASVDGIVMLDAAATMTPFFTRATTGLDVLDLVFGTGGAFGHDIYTTEGGRVLRVNSDGLYEEFANGFVSPINMRLAFDGSDALYVLDLDAARIYRITPNRCCTQAPPEVGFTGLGDLPGGATESYAYGLSADGTTVVGESKSIASSANPEAFRWRAKAGMIGLGDLPGGSFKSVALGVSADGSSVVGYSHSASADYPANPREGFLWTDTNGMVALGDAPGGWYFSQALAISDDGQVIGGETILGPPSPNSGYAPPCRWVSEVGPTPLSGTGTETYGEVNGISGNSNVLVGYRAFGASSNPLRAFRWTETGGLEDIGDLPGGVEFGVFSGTNFDGSICVGVGNHTGTSSEAMKWDAVNGLVGLNDLVGGSLASWAFGVSPDGTMIVGYGNSASGQEGVLWDETFAIHRVADVLPANGVMVPCGWTLTSANKITENCGVITIIGNGINPNGDTEAWIASYIPGSPAIDPNAQCDDSNPCTDDLCAGAKGCLKVNNSNACDDDDSCTTNDVCSGGICAGTPPRPWGDITPADCAPVVSGCNVVNIDDILCVLSAFAGNYACAGGLSNADIVPCAGNSVINLDDILGVLNAFTGANQCPCVP